MSSTFVEPCKSIYSQLKRFDERVGVLDSNLMIGYVWADTKRATAATIITYTDEKAGVEACSEIAKYYLNERNELTFNMKAGDLNAVLNWLPSNFSILADSGDNPTTGGG